MPASGKLVLPKRRGRNRRSRGQRLLCCLGSEPVTHSSPLRRVLSHLVKLVDEGTIAFDSSIKPRLDSIYVAV